MNSDASRDLSQLSALFRAPRTGPTLDILDVTHSYKAMASDTGQQFSVWESIVPPGCGAPAHTHTREDEAFYVLSGEVLVEVEGTTDPLRLGTGAFLFAPRHRRHGYRNMGTDTARLLVFAMPGAPASIACSPPSTRWENEADTSRLPRPLLKLLSNTVSLSIRRLVERMKGATTVPPRR
jgi:quercetin dioxygenase-like cupin family protein